MSYMFHKCFLKLEKIKIFTFTTGLKISDYF